jgi:nucleoside-diphosphate-sugar epimerase
MKPRACYTESKRMAENICVNYTKQYGVPTCIARVCFVYGPTFKSSDNRVIPQFLRKALNGQDIVLKSTGDLVRSYAYLFDVASGLFKILLEGKTGEAYNIANRNSNVSIREIAETIAELTGVKLLFDLPKEDQEKGYAPFSEALLDATKLEKLGWTPHYRISDGISNIVKILKAIEGNERC